MSDELQNGQTFDQYHRMQNAKYVGFRANHKGTHFDDLIQFVDELVFTTRMQLDEQDKALSINYAHGLELDDIGDNFSIDRNGLDDETYRFLLKSHHLSNKSKGTWHDVLSIAANLLGCNPEDVTIVPSRKIIDGKDTGDPNTVEIVDVDIGKVTHANLLPMLTDELQKAMAGGFKIKQIGFSTNIKTNAFVGISTSGHLEADISIPGYVEVPVSVAPTVYTGVALKFDYDVSI
ncbi:hypothetical protein LOSG293_110140 [Secundilactobacillus oryzae JCM 18671]|uniref:Uncharacterized protein n=1 Tax=Secundilactobacillus oryzae JCM 18671 TaxID=1291743 RepID=A0A081BI30_9LACO|nr:hypothetical protein [Secundilactobacillus oryzae]GAK47698.1 hypothetical protein LOSG293_110140 [Secundilactobacillus oryzae JCM 18671]